MITRKPGELLEWLGLNSFLTPEQIEVMTPLAAGFADAQALAAELIRRDWLTPYQGNQILYGRRDLLIVGPNRLQQRIGEGAMGEVFKAWNSRLERVVAVKMIHTEHLDKDRAMERFRREIRTSARLDHPNIALVRDADEAGNRPYLVMDFIDGENLARRVKVQGPLPVGQAVEFARQAALGLEHAHERGVVHRDVKPGNLFVTRGPDGAYLIKILDFGLARFDSESSSLQRLTQTGNVIGTVDYVAPEQTLDAHVADIRADIYSLGCTLFYLLTAKPPFAGSSVIEKVKARREGEPPSVRALRPEAPAALDAVLRKMMAREPEARYQTPLEAAEALAPFAGAGAGAGPSAVEAPPAENLSVTEATPSGPSARGWPTAASAPLAELAGSQDGPAVAFAHHVATSGIEVDTPIPETLAASPFNSATFRTAAAVEPATTRPRSAVGAPTRTLWLGVLTVALIGAVAIFWRFQPGDGAAGKRGHMHPEAALEVLPLPSVEFKDGGRKLVIVRIQRKEFRGDVKVRFEGLPEGFSADEVTIPRDQDVAELKLLLSYGMGAMQKDLEVVAVAENLQARATLPVRVVVSPKPRYGRE
jgi:tRNA A-37 threonylcarbamoyl transferase component Bud32